jgi:serine/threonine-protein kinase
MKDKLEKIDQKLKETLQNNINNLKKENNLIKISMKTVLNKEQNKELSEEKTNNDNNVKIGNYVLNERLGTGATAVVYKATNIKNKSTVALKMLHKHLMSEKWFKERIINEIEINKILTHPNIIKILEYDIEGEQPFIAFEYVNGKSLAKILEERKVIPLDESINIWIQILEAMDYAHQKGIIHRDLKPENILIREDKVVKITDFGISKRINMTLNLTQDFVGTPWYMAPEQIKNQKVDNRTDIYSMGIIFYQMITGKLPFETSENLYSIFKSHMLDNPIGANIFEKSYMPPDIEKIIRKMIEKEPKKRYTYCYEIIQELTPHLLLFSKKT